MPNKVPDGRPSGGPSVPTPGGPGPAPDRPSVPTGDSGGDFQPQPNPPPMPTPGINLTGGDREEVPDLDAELLDIALMEDPDAGGEIFAQAQYLHATPIDDGGEVGTQAQYLQVTPIDDGGEVGTQAQYLQVTPIDDGGEVARKAGGGQPDVHSDPEGGGEIAGVAGRARPTEVKDAHDRFALTEDPDGGGQVFVAMPADDGGEIVEDPDGGGEVAQLGVDGESTDKDHDDWDVELTDDPDGGDEIDGGFGTGATPPRPVTMTADDLRADPDDGGELTEDPDGGGEIATRPPLDGIGIDDLAMTEDPDAGGEIATPVDVEPAYAEPEPDVSDLEIASDFDGASHTFDQE